MKIDQQQEKENGLDQKNHQEDMIEQENKQEEDLENEHEQELEPALAKVCTLVADPPCVEGASLKKIQHTGYTESLNM